MRITLRIPHCLASLLLLLSVSLGMRCHSRCWRVLEVLLLVIMAVCCVRTAVAFSSRTTAFVSTCRLRTTLSSCRPYYAATRLYTTSSSDNNDTPSSSTAPLKSFVSFPAYQVSKPPPDVMPLESGRRVVCIGDVHGDYPALCEFLTIAGVMNESCHWIGGDTVCVQLGDVLDRGHHELACFELLAHLSRQAVESGGVIQLLYGNHEALNAVGLFQYALGDDELEHVLGTPMDLIMTTNHWRVQFAGNSPVRWAAFEPGGLLSETLCQHFKVAFVVGKTLCVHAGLTQQHLQQYGGIEGMNQQARDWIIAQHHQYNNNDGRYQTAEDVRKDAQNRANAASASMPECLGGGIGSHSPVWMRDYSQPNDSPPRNPKAQQMIDKVLASLKCDRMVMGHTPQFKINAALNNKAWRIDVGASEGVMGGTPEVLEIIHNGAGNGVDEVNILTRSGKVPASERQTVDSGILF